MFGEPTMKAVASGLKIFIINHKGADLAKSSNPTRLPGCIPPPRTARSTMARPTTFVAAAAKPSSWQILVSI
jgi:hypothetical protein